MIQKLLYFVLVLCILVSCKKEEAKIKSVESYTYAQLKPLLEKNDDTTYVINFWATWCGPCIKELPYFEKMKQEYANKNVEVLLVSVDFPKQVDKRLIPFLNKNKIKSKVILLDDANEDFWIKDIDSAWSGALPATIIYNKNIRKFYEQSFDYETLENELKPFLKS